MKQYIYVDGTLAKTTAVKPAVKLRQWIDNLQNHWQGRAIVLSRVSPDELQIVAGSGATIRIVNQ